MQPIVPDVTQQFYDSLAGEYDKFYSDWDAASREEGAFLDALFRQRGFDGAARVLDCACGVGTQALGLAALGWAVTGSDLSAGELAEAEKRAAARGLRLRLERADFRALEAVFPERFDIVIAMDNALPHMLSAADLARAVNSIAGRLRAGGLFAASIRDYDRILEERPRYSPPYIHRTEKGQRVLFQTWDWHGERYAFTQYIIEDEGEASLSRFACEYRATRRDELTALLRAAGFREISWLMPEESGFYQPVVLAIRG